MSKILQGLALLALSPGLLGLLRFMKARLQGRLRGAPTLLQPYRDLMRLTRQPSLRAKNTTWVFAFAPITLWTCYATLAFAIPVFGQRPLLQIDLITLAYIFTLARFTLALAGMDAGAPFGGLGSSRSMFVNLPNEVALILVGAALSLHWNTVSLTALVDQQFELGLSYVLNADLLLVAVAFVLTISLETGRIPIDNPGTHLELTMSQKAIMLEYAGSDLALLEWGEAVKLSVMLSLFVSLFLMPLVNGLTHFAFGILSFVVLLAIFVGVLAFWEVTRPKLRMRKVLQPAVFAAGFCLSAILYRVITVSSQSLSFSCLNTCF